MDYPSFLTRAERGQLPPVVLVHGADPQLLDDALAAATRGLLPDLGLVVVGRDVLDGREVQPEEIVRAARTLPLMTAARLVVVRHAQALGAKGAAVLETYLAEPNPSTCALFLADEPLDGGRDGKAHWLLRSVPTAGVVAIPGRRGRALEEWLRQRALAESVSVAPEAARLLVEWVGDDTVTLLGEVRKAALAAGPGQPVGVRDVEAVVGVQRLAGVYDLTRAIERREIGLALRTLDRLLISEEPMRLLGLLTSEVRLVWTIQDLGRRGQSTEQIARALRRPPGVVAARRERAAPPAALAAQLARCWEVERRIKSGGAPRAELAALVAELCAATEHS